MSGFDRLLADLARPEALVELAALFACLALAWALAWSLGRERGADAGIGGALRDPGGKVGGDGVGEFRLLRRHREVVVEVADGAEQQAFLGFAGDDDRLAGIAAFLPARL